MRVLLQRRFDARRAREDAESRAHDVGERYSRNFEAKSQVLRELGGRWANAFRGRMPVATGVRGGGGDQDARDRLDGGDRHRRQWGRGDVESRVAAR